MNSPTSTSWYRQAVLYLVGELTPEETAAFENQLAESQPVRDALVSAMETMANRWSIAGPSSCWRVQLRQRLRKPALGFRPWLTLAMAACLGAITTLAVLTGLGALRWSNHSGAGFSQAEAERLPGPTPPTTSLADAVEDLENLAAITYVDLTTAERVAHFASDGQKNANRSSPGNCSSPAAVRHLPLVEYFNQPCSHDMQMGM